MAQRRLKNWLQAYMDYSQHSEAPDSFHFWAGVSAVAGALRSHVWIDMGYFRWVPNFYIVFVAPPGIVSKSTTMGISMRLLREVPGIKFGPDTVTWQALVQSLAASATEFEVAPGEMERMSAITIQSSEFGTFLNPHDNAMVDVLVSLWDGQRGVWEKATKTMGNDRIVNPWVNIIAATTPSWIQGNFPEYMIGGGFASRTIFVYAERKRHLVAYPGDYITDVELKLRDDLIHDLEVIATEMIGAYKLSPEARAWGEAWYERHNERLIKTTPDDRIAGYLARKQTHIHKLAMILAAAERNELVLRVPDLEVADKLITSIEGVMPKVFTQISAPEARASNRIAAMVGRVRSIPRDELYRQLFQSMSVTEFESGLKGAVSAGLIKAVQRNNVVYLEATGRSVDAEQTDGKASAG